MRQQVAFIHQDLGLIEWMSIAENIAMASGYARRGPFIDRAACERTTREALPKVGCDFSPSMRVARLSRAEKSLVAIAWALAGECVFLFLDEPTASLPSQDVADLFVVLRRLRKDNVGMVYVPHRLDEVFEIADRVVVLRVGETVGVRDVAHTTPEELVDLIVGRKPRRHVRPVLSDEAPVLTLGDLRTAHAGPVSLDIRRGEVLGLVGLRAAGQEDIGRCLFGTTASAGTMTLDGKTHQPENPSEAMRAGIGLIPRDRVVESLATALSIRENFYLNPSATGRGPLSILSRRLEAELARRAGDEVGLRPNNPELAIDALSGSNQQKFVVGRWLAHGNKVLIDFMGPSLAAAGIKGGGAPFNVAAGDGSESAYQRVLSAQFHAVTVSEPLRLQGWQLVDEMNRALNGEEWSGYVSPLHMVTQENIEFDGGPNNTFDPENSYQ